MNKRDFYDKVVNKVLAEIDEIWGTKGEAYAPDNSDRLSNFKEVGRQLGLDPIQIWGVYFSKHRIAVESFIRRGCTDLAGDESIESRILDCIVYLFLLRGLILEKKIDVAHSLGAKPKTGC